MCIRDRLDGGQVRRVVVAARADGSAGMMLADPGGTTRLALGTGAGGEAHLACVDAAGRPRITVGTTGNAAAEAPGVPAIAAVTLLDESGATRIALRSNDGDAVLTFSDPQRRVRLSAGTFADGTVAVPGMVGEGEGMK